MNKLSKRAWFPLTLAGILLLGVLFITGRFFVSGADWASYRGDPGVSAVGSIDSYRVVARDGTELLDTTDGKDYCDDVALRTSLLHLLGDGGNVPSYMIDEYGDELVGYNVLSGTYSTQDNTGEMQLTISPLVQTAAYYAMAGRKGTVGVYNYQTGEVLCMLSMPAYDPENPPDIYTKDEEGHLVVKDEYDSVYFNRFTWSTYIPGSIFKLVTSAAALENIEDINERTFECTGSVNIGGKLATCHSQNGHGIINFKEALAKSCNVAFAEISSELGDKILTEYAERMGITDSISFDGLTTTPGNFDLSKADEYATAWAGIGQYNDEINPCQFMTMVGAIANGGRAALPHVVEQVSYGGKTGYTAKTENGKQILSRETADRLADMMRFNVDNNYIWSCNFAGLDSGGKSGTAQKDNGNADALFAGFSSDPDYPLAYIVVVEDGGSGSGACLPVVQQILNASVAAMNAE